MAFDKKRPASEAEEADEHETVNREKVGMDEQGTWSPDIHRAFVEAIMSQGIERASPAVIQKEMTLNTEAVTTERIKSKLQKYRSAKEKSLAQFMKEYDEWHWNANAGTLTQNVPGAIEPCNSISDPQSMARSTAHALGGDVAAVLTHAVMSEDQSEAGAAMKLSASEASPAIEGILNHRDGSLRIAFPHLSEHEKGSSIGKALEHVWGILGALSEQRARDFNRKPEITTPDDPATSIFKQPTNSIQYSHGLHSNMHDPNQEQQEQSLVSPHYSFESAHATGADDADSPEDSHQMVSDGGLLGVLEAIEEAPWGVTGDDCGSLDGNS